MINRGDEISLFREYQIHFNSEKLVERVQEYLTFYNKNETAAHSIEVAEEAKRLAVIFGVSAEKAYVAGLLHDISAVIPNEKRVELHQELGEEVLEAEVTLPMILHQKQSVFIARDCFNVTDKEVLSAIECHTTLKGNATSLDKVVFIADKIKWDRSDSAPYRELLEDSLTVSLDEGCRTYLKWALRDIIVLHPWLAEAIKELNV